MPSPTETSAKAAAEATVIRVIDVRRSLTDPVTAGLDELAILLEAAQAAARTSAPGLAAPEAEGALRAFLDIARFLQSPQAPLLQGALPGLAPPAAAGGDPPAVVIRELLTSPAVRPIVLARGQGAAAESGRGPPAVRARAAGRVRAVGPGGEDLAVAAEEPVAVGGFVVDPLAAGSAVRAALGGAAFPGPDVYVTSGAFTPPLLAVGSPVRPPEAPAAKGGAPPGSGPADPAAAAARLRRQGLIPLFLDRKAPGAAAEALLRQARAATGFFLGGGAAATAFARLATTLRGAAQAPPPAAAGLRAAGPPMPAPPGPGEALAGWRDAAAAARLRYLLGRLARTEPVAADAPETWAFGLSPLEDLFRVGALGTYLHVLTEGPDAAAVGALLARLVARAARERHRIAAAAETAVATTQARLCARAIEDKFGVARLRAVLGPAAARPGDAAARARRAPGGDLAPPPPAEGAAEGADAGALLARLAPAERRLVEAGLAAAAAEWEAAAASRCEHVRLARRARTAPTAEGALAALRELDAYLVPVPAQAPAPPGAAGASARGAPRGVAGVGRAAESAATGWLSCRNCGRRALCPHARELVLLLGRRAPYEEVRTRLLRFAVRAGVGGGDGGAAAGGDAYAYFCRVCGERLGELVEEDRTAELLGRFGDLDAGLRARVWALALAAAPLVRFPVPTDERIFAASVADTVYPLLLAAEEADVAAARGRRRRAPVAAAAATAAGRGGPGRPFRGRGGDAPGDREGDVDARTLLYAIVFVYAFILRLVQVREGAGPGREVGFAGVRPGAKLSAYAERMLRTIAEAHRGLIAQVEGASPDFLKARLAEAFRAVRGVGGGGDGAAADPEAELAAQTLTVDPAYRYAASVARVAGDIPLAPPEKAAAARREFELLLGASLPDLVRLARESARDPALAPLYVRRVGAPIPPGPPLDLLVKGPRTNLHAKLYEPRADAAGAAALRAFREGPGGGAPSAAGGAAARPPARARAPGPRHGPADAKGPRAPLPRPARETKARGPANAWAGGAYRQTSDPAMGVAMGAAIRGQFFEAYRLFALYTKGVTDQATLGEFSAELAEFRRREARLAGARTLAAMKTFYDFRFPGSQQYVPVAVPITAAFDESGARHDWAKAVTYVFRAPDGREVLAGGKGAGGAGALVLKAREDGTVTPDMVLVDLVCPGCGVRASATGALDAAKTARAVRAAGELSSFFIFFETRCPAGGVHAWGSQGDPTRCGKCGLGAATAKAAAVAASPAALPPEARAYYDRYRTQFALEKRAGRAAAAGAGVRPLSEEEAATAAAGSAEDRRLAAAADAWRPDYTLIVRAAELAGVSPATIEALGATEGRELADVAEGRGAPPPPDSHLDPRIFAVDAEVRLFLADYGALRNAGRGPGRPPPAAAALLAEAGVPPLELAALPQALPDVGADYRALFAAVTRRRLPADALAFAVQSLCRMALEAAAVPGPPAWAPRLGEAFARRELARILRGQRLFAKPGPFNWAIFETGEEGADIPEQAGDVGEDVLEELLGRETEEAPDDPFSGEGMDYDVSEGNPNNEAP